MNLTGKRLGILISVGADNPRFETALRLGSEAVGRGVEVYLYLLDDGVAGLVHAPLQDLRRRGVRLFACAFAARQRGLPLTDQATFVGLTALADVLSSVDRFVSFSH